MSATPRRLSSLLNGLWSGAGARRADRRAREGAVQAALERIVDQANPAIRGLGGYRRRLAPVVEGLLGFSAALVEQIPGPVEVSAERWASDPLVNTLFGNVERIRQVVSGPAVRAWQRAHPRADGDALFALLAAMPHQQGRLGMELVGDQVRSDVPQTTLGFTDHELFAVGADIDAVRGQLRDQVLDLLASIAVAALATREERIAAAEQAVRMLKLKLKVIAPRAAGIDLVLEQSAEEHQAERQRLQAQLAESERDLAVARDGMGDLAAYLDRLLELLADPGAQIGVEEMRLWVDRMNIVRDAGSADAHEIVLTRARRPDRPGRVAQLIRFPRSLIESAGDRLAAAERALGI